MSAWKNVTRVLRAFPFALIIFAMPILHVHADHLTDQECDAYFQCILGVESALNRCYDNNYLKKIKQTRVMCQRIAQHECKAEAGILRKGKQLRLIRPVDDYGRPQIMEGEASNHQEMKIYNYAGWNHCPPRYQGLEGFWCDPKQLRYPPRPWCDVLPIYQVADPTDKD